MFMLLSLELEEVIKMYNKSIPWPLLEESFSLTNCAAELYPSLNSELSASVHVSTVPSTGLHNTAVKSNILSHQFWTQRYVVHGMMFCCPDSAQKYELSLSYRVYRLSGCSTCHKCFCLLGTARFSPTLPLVLVLFNMHPWGVK